MNMKRLVYSFFVTVIISFVIFFILNDYGIVWDEPIHFRNADQYVAWYKKPDFGSKDAFFRVTVDDVHPPFRKVLAGLTHEIFTNRLRIIDNTRGYRVSSLLFVIPFTFLFSYVAIGLYGLFIGLLVTFMFSFLPHVLFLTPLVTMDYAVAVLWFVTVISIFHGMNEKKWMVISGILLGFTLVTKLHGYLLFVPLVIYWAWTFRKIFFLTSTVRKKLDVILILFSIIVIAFIIYFALWPWLWSSPIVKMKEYFSIQLAHKSVPVFIFGKNYLHAPWWYTPVMFLTTTPVYILLFFFIGALGTLRNTSRSNRFFLMNALYPMIFFSLPWVYRYDGVRLFLASYPFVCLVAGSGMKMCVDSVRQGKKIIVVSIMLIGWIVTLYSSVIRIHPWESSYYNELIGGMRGATRMGFETEYWGNSYKAILPWMNANKKNLMCVFPTTHPFYYYQAMGQIEPGVNFTADRNSCVYAVVLMRQGLFVRDPYIASVVASQEPVFAYRVDGVPLVSVYYVKITGE